MNVVWHDDVTSHCNPTISCRFGKSYETSVDLFVSQQFLATMGVESDEVQGRVVLMERLQSWGAIGH